MKKFFIFPVFLFFIIFSNLLYGGKVNHYKLVVGSVTVNESAGTASLQIRVDPKITDNNENITVDFRTVDDSALAGADYTADSGTVTLRKHVQTSDITLNILDDSIPESQEIFTVIIDNAQLHQPATTGNDVTIETDTGTITINDDDSTGTTPTISVTDKTVNEGDGTVMFTITRSAVATSDVTFNYATDDITAVAGMDYTLKTGTATIPAGSDRVNILVPIIDDLMAGEGDETFSFFISNPSTGTVIGNGVATATIHDNDTALSLAINDASIAESDTDVTAVIKVLFSEALPNDLNLTFETRDGNSSDPALAGSDYVGIPSTSVIVPAGSTEYDINVTIIGDTTGEPAEEFYIAITDAVISGGIVRADDISKITIFDNDNNGGCSSFTGLMTINEYQNNPNYKDPSHPLANNAGKVPGNYVEIKYIDFLVKQYVNSLWSVSIYTTAGTATLTWADKDPKCTDPRYEIFEMTNHVMGKQGYVVLTDANGNEVDVLNIDNSNHYNPSCNYFPYDTDFDSSAQNKDLFRVPDGTGDWYDHGSGANSGGSRCINKDGVGVLYTEFDATDIYRADGTLQYPLPNTKTFSSVNDVRIKTKVVNRPFDLNILWLDLSAYPIVLKTVGSIDVNVSLGYLEGGYAKKLPGNNPAKHVWFNNDGQVKVEGFNYDKAVQGVHVLFEYCTDSNLTLYSLADCAIYSDLQIVTSVSRDTFTIRPDHFDVNISSPETLIAGKATSLAFTAWDGDPSTPVPTVDYNETQNSSFAIDINISDPTKICPEMSIGMTPNVDFTDGLDEGDFIFHNVGDVNMTIHEIDGEEFAKGDAVDPTPDDDVIIGGVVVVPGRLISEHDVSFTIIPDHFDIDANLTDHNNISDFTYFHDINSYETDDNHSMGSTLSIDIQARGAGPDNNITSNYMETCYAKDTNLTLDIADTNITYPGYAPALTQFLYYNPVEDDGTANSGEGEHNFTTPITSPIVVASLPIENTKATFPSDAPDGNGTTHIEYKLNFDRKQNLVVNPFRMVLNDINITDEDNVTKGTLTLTDNNATYYYARSRPAQFFYEDITTASVQTPIAIDIFCDLGFTVCPTMGIDTNNAQTDEFNWWLSFGHIENTTQHDGNITIQIGTPTEGAGSPAVAPTTVAITAGGINTGVTVTSNATSVPMTVPIELVNSIDSGSAGYKLPLMKPYTNTWLIYNAESANSISDPFYKVRFIGTSDWAGEGDTGHVVDSNASTKKNRRLGW